MYVYLVVTNSTVVECFQAENANDAIQFCVDKFGSDWRANYILCKTVDIVKEEA